MQSMLYAIFISPSLPGLQVTRAGFAPGDLDLALAGNGEFRFTLAPDIEGRRGNRPPGDQLDHTLQEFDRAVPGDRLKAEVLGPLPEKAVYTVPGVLDLFRRAAGRPGARAGANLRRRLVRRRLGRMGAHLLELAAILTRPRCDGKGDADLRLSVSWYSNLLSVCAREYGR